MDQDLKDMHSRVEDYFVRQYMDVDNGKDVEKKRRVLQALLDGKRPPEIPEYDDVLDKWDDKPVDVQDIHMDF